MRSPTLSEELNHKRCIKVGIETEVTFQPKTQQQIKFTGNGLQDPSPRAGHNGVHRPFYRAFNWTNTRLVQDEIKKRNPFPRSEEL